MLADDHAPIAEYVRTLLAPDFDVVAAVGDGRRALDVCAELDPDVAVLDISMPGLDGFQVARALRDSGSRTRVVFLTMHKSDEFVAAALAAGGEGYVHKPRIDRDLASTLEHVLAGRRYAPSVAALAEAAGDSGCHALGLYKDARERIEGWRALAYAALERGDVVSIVAPGNVAADLTEALDAIGGHTADAARAGRYFATDAMAALADILPSSGFDAGRVTAIIADTERARLSCEGGPAPRVTILGELSGSLGRMGRREDALRIERCWQSEAQGLPFFTVCCYAADCFDEASAFYAHISAQHDAIQHADSVR